MIRNVIADSNRVPADPVAEWSISVDDAGDLELKVNDKIVLWVVSSGFVVLRTLEGDGTPLTLAKNGQVKVVR